MKEYWIVRAKVTGRGDNWWIGKDSFLRQTKPEAKQFKNRADAYAGIAEMIRSYEYYDSKTIVTFVLVHHKTKPRGAKVGTWAWACEQMLSGSVVWKCAHQARYYLSYDRELLEFTENVSAAKRATVTAEMMRATSWGRVNP